MRLYLDAAPVIYAVEQVAPFFPVVDARLSTTGVVRMASDLNEFKTPDAVHLAAAVITMCDAFLTNDHRLDRFPDIAIEIVRP